MACTDLFLARHRVSRSHHVVLAFLSFLGINVFSALCSVVNHVLVIHIDIIVVHPVGLPHFILQLFVGIQGRISLIVIILTDDASAACAYETGDARITTTVQAPARSLVLLPVSLLRRRRMRVLGWC
jgi:hypothetical protein